MPRINGLRDRRKELVDLDGLGDQTVHARLAILALTANAMDHQLAEYRQAGMDGLIAKPIEIDKLFAAISQAIDPGHEGRVK